MAKPTTQTHNMKTTQTPVKQKPQLLDLDAVGEEYSDVPEILPRLQLVENKEIVRKDATVRFEEKTPRIIPWEKNGKDASFPVIEITDELDGSRKTLACSAKSMQIGLARIKKAAGTLLGQRAQISVDIYDHEDYGKTFGYRVVHLSGKGSKSAETDDE